VEMSFEIPEYAADATAVGVIRSLAVIHAAKVDTRFYQGWKSLLRPRKPPPITSLLSTQWLTIRGTR
jgi:hypothetical protein